VGAGGVANCYWHLHIASTPTETWANNSASDIKYPIYWIRPQCAALPNGSWRNIPASITTREPPPCIRNSNKLCRYNLSCTIGRLRLVFRAIRALQIMLLVSQIISSSGAIAQDTNLETEVQSNDDTNTPALFDRTGNNETQDALCLMIESAAKAADLPVEFFVHVIWQESHFQSQAVGPMTRTGRRAQGIAQFMPETARERGLLDPLNPVLALPKAAEFLAELRRQFGNLGLAAAAYNAGPRRVQEWLTGNGGMPAETRNYVLAITGRGLEDWVGKNDKVLANQAKGKCQEMVALLRQKPSRFVSQLEQSVTRAATMPWGVQIATGFDRDRALAAYSLAVKQFDSIIGKEANPTLQPILFRSRGTSSFYQVRVGTSSRREAENLCRKIRTASGACIVKRRGA